MGVAIPLGYVEDKSSGALVVDGSLRFDSSKSNYVSRTPGSAGNRKTWTWSGWVKRNDTSSQQTLFSAGNSGTNRSSLLFDSSVNGALRYFNYASSVNVNLISSQVFRDAAGWYHIVVAFDSTQATEANRLKFYVNGVQVTNFSTATYPSQNLDVVINNNLSHSVGRAEQASPAEHLSGQISNVYFIDGQALDASYFGFTDALTNTWRPKKYTGNLKAYTVPSGFSYWTGMNQNWNTGGSTSSGNDFINQALPSSGKVYWEVTLNSPATYRQIGIAQGASGTGTSYNDNIFGFYYNGNPPIWLTKNSSGTTRGNAVSHGSGTGTTWTSGDKLMFAWDADNDKIWFGLNGTWYASGNPATGSNPIISGEDLSANAHYFKQGRTDSENITTLTNITSGNASYFSNLDMVYDNRNTFYLPFDGNSPIGQDQSGRGNNWTPVNFGGSNTLEKATGALPILNTDGGGKVARVGVRTDSSASSLVLALPLVGVKDDVSNRINSGSTTKTVTATNAVASSAQSNFYGGSFYFDGSGDYLNAGTSTDFVFGTGQFTIEGWIYNQSYNGSNGGTGDSYPTIISTYSGETVNWIVRIYRTGALTWYSPDGGGTNNNSAGGLTQLNTWYHFAYVREGTGSNQFKMYLNGVLVHTLTDSNNYTANETVVIGSQSASNPRNYHTGYLQDFRIYKGLAKYTQNFIPASTDPDILPDTPSGVSYTSNLTQITDGAVTTTDAGNSNLSIAESEDFNFGTGDFTIEGYFYINSSGSNNCIFDLRDAGSSSQYFLKMASATAYDFRYSGSSLGTFAASDKVWNHIAISRSSGTTKIFVNGLQTNSFSDTNNASNTGPLIISSFNDTTGSSSSFGFNGFLSNLHVVKGTALYTSNFTPPSAPISSVANTKLLCCKSNSSATAFDVSPGTITANGNAAATNFNPFTVNINTQRGKQSGYATLNPLSSASNFTISNGNLKSVDASSTTNARQYANTSISSGKYYFETTIETASSTTMTGFAVNTGLTNSYPGSLSTDWTYHSSGLLYNNGSTTSTTAATSAGDVIGNAIDMDTGKIWFSVNGNFVGGGVPSTGTNASFSSVTGTITPVFRPYASTISVNFGQKPFKFPPPAGFQPLALANTPRPTIVRPDQFVGIVTYYAADGVAGIATGLSFKPDLVWVKSRTSARSNVIVDSVRGTSSVLWTNLTDAQLSSSQYVSQFNSNGFNYGVAGDVTNNSSLVGWCWKAGGNSNTYNINDVGYATASAAGLTAGTITPTGASVNTKSGFSIITYTGTGSGSATIDHGLGKKPQLIFVKKRNAISPWYTQHGSLGAGQIGYLNATDAFGASSGWNSTEPTNQVFSVASSLNDANTFVAYLWAEIPGFSKFGRYTGTDTSNYIHLGFRPALVIIKNATKTSSAFSSWMIQDAKRSPYNPTSGSNKLWANRATQEGYRGDGSETSNLTANNLDFDSNGFYIPSSASTELNETGQTFIYAAWAETPTQNLYGAQANAR